MIVWQKNTSDIFLKSVGEFILFLPKLIHHPFKTISPVKAPRKGQWRRWSGKIWSEIRTATFFRSHCDNFNPVAKHEPPKEKKEKGWGGKHEEIVLVLWSRELCQTQYLLFPRYSGKVPWDSVSPKADKKNLSLIVACFHGLLQK